MHIESVTAKAFGPLRDSTLDLQPGFNVIVGRNESAKSTWHAAIYAAICGRARRKGPPTREDREFAEQYRPWKGKVWHVEAWLHLDDGRNIEIHHELNQAVDCAAIDLGLGRDVSSEIMHDGAPDASRWLGMNRAVFAATACVRQSEILAVLHSAGGLQQQLEAAATHAGTSDPTASEAIRLIDSFKSEQVGLDRTTSKKPLRRARTALEAAKEALRQAEQKHAEYLGLVSKAAELHAEADRLKERRQEADERVQSMQDLLALAASAQKAQDGADDLREAHENAATESAALQERLDRARELDRELGGREPVGNQVSEQIVAEVVQALTGWRTRPQPVELQGPDAEELQRQLDGLPPMPTGDSAPDPVVESAAHALDRAEVLLQATLGDRPAVLAEPDPALESGVSVGASALRDWASRLDTIDEVDPQDLQAARNRESAAQQSLTAAEDDATKADREFETALQSGRPAGGQPRRSPAMLVGATAAAIAAVAAIAMFIVGSPVIGSGLGAAAVLAAVVALVAQRKTGGGPPETATTPGTVADSRQRRESAHDRLLKAQAEALEARSSLRQLDNDARDATAERSDLEATCQAKDLPTDAHSLRVLATRVDKRQQDAQVVRGWEERRDRDQEAVARAEDALRRALQTRGVEGSDSRSAYAQYVRDCETHANQAKESAKRPSLERALNARRRDERQVASAIEAAEAAASALTGGASRAGLQVGDVSVEDAPDVVAALERWLLQRETESSELDAQRTKWTDLQTQLNGLTLAELDDETEAKKSRVSEQGEEAAEAARQAAQRWTELRRKAQEAHVELPDDRAAVPLRLTALRSTAQADLTSLRGQSEKAQALAHDAQGQQKNAAKQLPPVPDAEEQVEACQVELQRVQGLASTLDSTRKHLAAAQETVHRTIAPTLQKTLVEWLPAVTEDRYSDATVDPETLEVKIRAGSDWVPAQRLSFGTAEQIYLLLRVALVTHIANAGTSCPMLLDDVTVQADAVRTRALLDTLATLATDRQIVLFAQEPLVEQWAGEQIAAGRGINVIALEQLPIG